MSLRKCADCLIFIAAVFDDQSRHGHQMRDVRYRRAFSHFGSMRSPRGLSIQPWQRLSTRRKSAPPIMTPFHSIATDWSRDSPRRSSFFAAIGPATLLGRRLPSTVDLKRQALAYRRCVRKSVPNGLRVTIKPACRGARPGLWVSTAALPAGLLLLYAPTATRCVCGLCGALRTSWWRLRSPDWRPN